MNTYEIKEESGKWNIYYFIDGKQELKEFYSYDGINPVSEIRKGYDPKDGSSRNDTMTGFDINTLKEEQLQKLAEMLKPYLSK